MVGNARIVMDLHDELCGWIGTSGFGDDTRRGIGDFFDASPTFFDRVSLVAWFQIVDSMEIVVADR